MRKIDHRADCPEGMDLSPSSMEQKAGKGRGQEVRGMGQEGTGVGRV